MRQVRFNSAQRAAMRGLEVDGRPFVELDVLHRQEDGSDAYIRVLMCAENARALADALHATCDDTAPAQLERSNV